MESDSPQSPRLSNWKIAGIVAVALFLVVMAITLWLRSIAGRNWEKMKARTTELIAVARARSAARPVLRGTAEPGNAWTDYNEALKHFENSREDFAPLSQFFERKPTADRALVDTLLAKHAKSLALLRRGAGRAEGQYAMDWEAGFALPLPNLLPSQRLATLAAVQSRILREGGKHREAMELLLDTCQFGRDLGHNGVLISEMVGLAIYWIALDELRDLLASKSLSPDDLAELGRELEILDRNMPDHGITLLNEAVFARSGVIKTPGEILTVGTDLMSWRYGFSSRIMLTKGIDENDVLLDRAVAVNGKSWAEIRAESDRIKHVAEQSPNPFIRMMTIGTVAGASPGQARLSQIRTLRTAVRFIATGEVLDLDDPFGTKLRTFKTGSKLKIWSLGQDGVDDAGVGTWKDIRTGDIVLEVER